MIRAAVLTPWIGTGTLADPYRPRVTNLALTTCSDVTGQAGNAIPPSPNLVTVEVTCAEAVFDQIEADSTYLVLWSETL